MGLVKHLRQLLTGANSRAETRTEQSEWWAHRTTTVEVTVEQEESILVGSRTAGFAEPPARVVEADTQTHDPAAGGYKLKVVGRTHE